MGTTNTAASSAAIAGDPLTFDAELKQKWVDALRGGQFRQAYCMLSDGEGYCCLGVLCVVSGRGITGLGSRPDYDYIEALVSESTKMDLINMNDGDKKSFPEIADWIEQRIPVPNHQSADAEPQGAVVPCTWPQCDLDPTKHDFCRPECL